jgi:Cu/Ag efflux pump CusA
MLGDLMASAQPIEIKVFGTDREKLNELSEKIATEVQKIEGVEDVFNGIVIAGPSIELKPNAQNLAQFNVSSASLQYQLKTHLEGNIVGNIPEKEQLTDIRMIFPGYQNSVEHLKEQLIFLPGGKLKPLTELADVTIKEGSPEINRENLQSVGMITARLNQRDLGSAMHEIKQLIANKIFIPHDYHVEYGGAYADQQKSFSELLFILLLAGVLIFTLMLFLFKDYKAALLILLIAVLGTVGSLIALFITKTPLNVGSYTGLIMIVGIIGKNAIFTFQQFSTKLSETGIIDEALVYAVSTRLRPKLMTALGAIIALTPLATGIGTGAQMHQPLAIAVIGGVFGCLALIINCISFVVKVIC